MFEARNVSEGHGWVASLTLLYALAACDEPTPQASSSAAARPRNAPARTGTQAAADSARPTTSSSTGSSATTNTSSSAAASATAGSPAASASASTSASTEGKPNERTNRRGVWLWEFDKRGPNAEKSAEILAAAGVSRVFVKGTNGAPSKRWADNASRENLKLFTDRGIEVWLFGYFYSPDIPDQDGRTWGSIEEQVKAMVDVANVPEVTGVIVDAEVEFKDRPKEAASLCTALRKKLPQKKLGYTTFGWLKPNKTFPYAAFDKHCGDAFLPQVYYAFGWPGGVRASMERLEQDRRAMKLTAPMWPVQSNEKDPSVEDLELFFKLAGPDASVFYLHHEGTPQTKKLSRLSFR